MMLRYHPFVSGRRHTIDFDNFVFSWGKPYRLESLHAMVLEFPLSTRPIISPLPPHPQIGIEPLEAMNGERPGPRNPHARASPRTQEFLPFADRIASRERVSPGHFGSASWARDVPSKHSHAS